MEEPRETPAGKPTAQAFWETPEAPPLLATYHRSMDTARGSSLFEGQCWQLSVFDLAGRKMVLVPPGSPNVRIARFAEFNALIVGEVELTRRHIVIEGAVRQSNRTAANHDMGGY